MLDGVPFLHYDIKTMDELIKAVAKALGVGASTEDIHDSLLSRGLSEDEIFLLIKAGENLYKALEDQQKELAARPAPFGRR